ncbi:hypothetical protein [Paenibacillus ehimensis]|uniref:hypothetical protein n=1 Tax=Paenibacillus ehimensis TaxID=79264 RepID=UPI0004726C52|nr:hypothetical protein [Paenibacillus ehimensis]
MEYELRITMKREVFETLEDRALLEACIEPTIRQIRGKGLRLKREVYAGLTPGQQALLMFQVLYGHAHSEPEYYWFVSHYISLGVWSEVKAGMRYFGDEAMLRIYEETEAAVEAKNRQPDGGWRHFAVMDLDGDAELAASVARLFARYHQAAPETIRRIGERIRSIPGEFAALEG